MRVSGADYGRLGDEAESMVTWTADRAFLRLIAEGRCAQLASSATLSGENEVHCRIYAQRPEPCRELERGSPGCLAELADKALRAEAFRTA